MTYTPKPGDRVTSPLLNPDRTWTVEANARQQIGVTWWWCVDEHGNRIPEEQGRLTPVTPPLPPEPAVGSVVWDGERYWQRGGARWWHQDEHCEEVADWPDLADKTVPVVPVTTVANRLRELGCPRAARELETEFGGAR